jgi:hypothetical protein
MVRQAHHERTQQLTVRPEPIEELIQSFLKATRHTGSRAGARCASYKTFLHSKYLPGRREQAGQ